MRRLKLGQLLDTLPERLALARTNRLPHPDFLELLLADEVTRRDRESAARRAKAAHLDPAMQLEAWDDTAAVSFDQQLWAELTSLRFLADAYNVLIMGPVGVGKTFLANALGHIAIRRAAACTPNAPTNCSNGSRRTAGRQLRRRDAQTAPDRPAHHRRLGAAPAGRHRDHRLLRDLVERHRKPPPSSPATANRRES